jgi:hypothetical protein
MIDRRIRTCARSIRHSGRRDTRPTSETANTLAGKVEDVALLLNGIS